jgi:hypothetical protein
MAVEDVRDVLERARRGELTLSEVVSIMLALPTASG